MLCPHPVGPCGSSASYWASAPASGYYAWRKWIPAPAAEPALLAWQVVARRVFTSHAGRYGQRWLRAQLRREGHEVGQ